MRSNQVATEQQSRANGMPALGKLAHQDFIKMSLDPRNMSNKTPATLSTHSFRADIY